MERSMHDWLQSETLSEKTTKKTKPKANYKANRGGCFAWVVTSNQDDLKMGLKECSFEGFKHP